MKYPFIQELRARGMLDTLLPGTEERLAQGKTAAYIGFDPTASSLHIGSLATIMLLKHFQRAGHQPYVLVGGATGMVGDPSFKAKERGILSEDTLRANQAGIEKQLLALLNEEGYADIRVLNNYDWFKNIGLLPFLRDIGKHISVNYMMAKDSVKARLVTGISYTEFAYQLLQGYDFYYLHKHYNIEMQMGGTDQFGNITTGLELIRKKWKKPAYGLTTPLLTKSDGTKFGKTEQGTIWLEPEMTSPYSFYQFWLNISDLDAKKLIYVMTLLPIDAIASCIEAHDKAPHHRILQKRLAHEVTTFVHGIDACRMAQETTKLLFDPNATIGLHERPPAELAMMLRGIPPLFYPSKQRAEMTLLSLLCEATNPPIFSSKRVAREMLAAGAIRVNQIKQVDPSILIQKKDWLVGEYILIQKGKKQHFLVKKIS